MTTNKQPNGSYAHGAVMAKQGQRIRNTLNYMTANHIVWVSLIMSTRVAVLVQHYRKTAKALFRSKEHSK